jgi:orotidine-5'-phosphate decarboxylase
MWLWKQFECEGDCRLGKIIRYDHSIIPACDVKAIEDLERLVKLTHGVTGIGAYKVGSILTIRYGLVALVAKIREFSDLPVIYDHQKAMTDINDLGRDFASVVKDSGADALIGFPQSGPVTEEAWIEACKDVELKVIIGGEMTHPKFKRSEGGYIADDCLDEMYLLAARCGVCDFVVPGNRTDRVAHYKSILKPLVGDSLTFYAPGFVAQGGTITDAAKAAADLSWHAIVGRAIYEAKDVKAAAENMVSQLAK